MPLTTEEKNEMDYRIRHALINRGMSTQSASHAKEIVKTEGHIISEGRIELDVKVDTHRLNSAENQIVHEFLQDILGNTNATGKPDTVAHDGKMWMSITAPTLDELHKDLSRALPDTERASPPPYQAISDGDFRVIKGKLEAPFLQEGKGRRFDELLPAITVTQLEHTMYKVGVRLEIDLDKIGIRNASLVTEVREALLEQKDHSVQSNGAFAVSLRDSTPKKLSLKLEALTAKDLIQEIDEAMAPLAQQKQAGARR